MTMCHFPCYGLAGVVSSLAHVRPHKSSPQQCSPLPLADRMSPPLQQVTYFLPNILLDSPTFSPTFSPLRFYSEEHLPNILPNILPTTVLQ